MRKFIVVVLFFVLFHSLGCSQHRVKSTLSGQGIHRLREALVLKPEKLKNGGTVLFVPFSAGAGVAASDDLDRISMMIVKGVADVLADDSASFKLLSADDSQSADFVIKGRILQLNSKSKLTKPWGKKPRHVTLSVQGSLLGVEEDDLLAKFAQSKDFRGKDVRLEVLAYEIGVEIGHFLSRAAGDQIF